MTRPQTITQADPEIVRRWHANLQAEKLRRLGMSYDGIQIVMREYHGIDRNAEHWRSQLRRQGCPSCPRGQGRRGVAA